MQWEYIIIQICVKSILIVPTCRSPFIFIFLCSALVNKSKIPVALRQYHNKGAGYEIGRRELNKKGT